MPGVQARPSRLIDVNALSKGHTLSFGDQPYFADLMKLMRANGKIALMVGAGASIDSGLPTWYQLLDQIATLIPEEEIRKIALADISDPLRKAENIQTLVLQTTGESATGMVRKALFPADKDPKPGDLVESIARLVAVDPQRFRIVTTNFDSMLEDALEALGISTEGVSLQDYLGNMHENQADHCYVVHLHGRVSKNDSPPPLRPLILTESEFLRHGPDAKRAVRAAMSDTAAVVFVGISLTDPNVVGPLWEIANSDDPEIVHAERSIPKFVLSVVAHPGGGDTTFEIAAKVARYKSLYLDEKLSARPILLKSYSQLVQAINELGLCTAEPATYVLRPRSGRSTRYGVRFSQALKHAYEAIEASRATDLPKSSSQLSDKLDAILNGNGGLVRLIEKLLREKAGVAGLGEEKFGLFLWLRMRGKGGIKAPYHIHMVGSSTYAHRESWSLFRPDEISFNSDYMASRCLFVGGVQIQNLDLRRAEPPTWRGIMARPLILRGFTSSVAAGGRVSDMYDRLTLGSVTLNTTHNVVEDPEIGECPEPRSALAVLERHGALQDVHEALNTLVMSRVLFTGPATT